MFLPDILAVRGVHPCEGIVRLDYTGEHFHTYWLNIFAVIVLCLLRRGRFPNFKMERQPLRDFFLENHNHPSILQKSAPSRCSLCKRQASTSKRKKMFVTSVSSFLIYLSTPFIFHISIITINILDSQYVWIIPNLVFATLFIHWSLHYYVPSICNFVNYNFLSIFGVYSWDTIIRATMMFVPLASKLSLCTVKLVFSMFTDKESLGLTWDF